ncbi:MAG: FixH family protein [Acidimicrobiales bacterium]
MRKGRARESAAEDNDGGASPLFIVAGTLLTVVLVSFAIYSVGDYSQDTTGGAANLAGEAAAGACGRGSEDPSYSVALAATPDPPSPLRTSLLLTVRQGARVVTGAKVCLTADMPEMQHPGLNKVASEAAGGRYEAELQFGMGGSWRTAITIAEPGKPVVSVPMTIQVADIKNN